MSGLDTPEPVPAGRRRRVLVVARMSPRLNARTRRLVRSLSKAYDVRVICEKPRGLPPPDSGTAGHLVELEFSRKSGGRMHLRGLWRVLRLNAAGAWWVLSWRPDVVVCSDSLYVLPGAVASLAFRAGFVYNSHEVMWGMDSPRWMTPALAWSEKHALRMADAWMVPSEERRDLIHEYHGLSKPCLVVLNLPDPSQPGQEPLGFAGLRERLRALDRPIVMFQGSLQENRGLEALVELGRTGLVHVVIQGTGPHRGWAEKQASDCVTVLPPCPGGETAAWLKLADLSFIWYPSGTLNEQWACSNKLYASAFAHRPVLANRLPAFESFSSRYGGIWFFDSLESTSLHASVRSLLCTEGALLRLKREMAGAAKDLAIGDPDEDIRDAFRTWFPEKASGLRACQGAK